MGVIVTLTRRLVFVEYKSSLEKPTASGTAKQARGVTTDAQKIVTDAAFNAIFLEHWGAIHRAVMRIVGDQAEAEDLALEAFWRLYQHFPHRAREFNFGGWLYRVATNLGLNALRARRRRERHELQAAGWGFEANADDAVANVAQAEERARVRAVLGAMDLRQAQLLLLRYSGMSYAELATALNLAPGSVGTLLARAEREFESRYLVHRHRDYE